MQSVKVSNKRMFNDECLQAQVTLTVGVAYSFRRFECSLA